MKTILKLKQKIQSSYINRNSIKFVNFQFTKLVQDEFKIFEKVTYENKILERQLKF